MERSGGEDGAVSVHVATADGSAKAGSDYTATMQTVSWGSGDSSTKTVTVPILDDNKNEGNETFTLGLSNATGGAAIGARSTATVRIEDDDQAPQGPGSVEFSSFAYGADEGGSASLELRRTGGTAGQVSVDYQTVDGSATGGADFEPRSGTVTFAAGEDRSTIAVPIDGDSASEGVESLSVRLSNPTGGASLGALRTASVVVFDGGEQPQSLTADEVLCDGFRLAGFLDRTTVQAPNGDKPLGLNLTFTRSGDVAGIAYTGNGPGTAEHHLWFSTNPEETTLLRNPARPQLSAVSLTRNQTNSDLVSAGTPDCVQRGARPDAPGEPAGGRAADGQ